MAPRLVTVVAFVALTVASTLHPTLADGGLWDRWAPAALGALATLVGVWCAPLFAADGALPGTLFARWRPEWDRPKTLQVLSGTIATAVLVLALQFQPGTAAILGIAVAIGVGALLPAPGGVDAQHDAADPHAHRDA